MTDQNGAVQFETLVPGHYMGRAVHIHGQLFPRTISSLSANNTVATRLNTTRHPNNTISGGTVPHVGQLYFDQSLVDEVAKVAPYSANNQWMMKNDFDFLLMQGAGGGADPVLEYTLLGKDLSDGIFAWSNFGVDVSKNRKMRVATYCTETGCAQEAKAKKMTDLIVKGIGMLKGGPAPTSAEIMDALPTWQDLLDMMPSPS